MKVQISRIASALLGAVALQLAAVAQADDSSAGNSAPDTAIKSRGADAAQADLTRNWDYKGQDTGSDLNLRSDEELNADLNRDWDGPDQNATAEKRTPHSRSGDAAYDDLMRNWGG
jgi:hypothetical protein